MSHDHLGVMLDALLAIELPDGYLAARQERYDRVTDHTFRDVTISPVGLDVATFTFGTPGAYAHISVDDDGDTYIVGVFATGVGWTVQRHGHAAHYTTATEAVECAISELRGELRRQHRGW